MRGYLFAPDMYVIHLGGDSFWAYGAEAGPLDDPRIVRISRRFWDRIDWCAHP
jgi:hypothetical protein